MAKDLGLGFRLIKIIDIGYITVIYFISGLILARLFDNYLDKFNKDIEKTKPTAQIILEVIMYLWINGMTIYIVRNLIEHIPSPFEGLYGLKHNIIGELKHAPILEFTLLYYQIHLTDKLRFLYDKFSSTNKPTV